RRSNPSRRLVYGLCESLEIAVELLVESKMNEGSMQHSQFIVKEEVFEDCMETTETSENQGHIESTFESMKDEIIPKEETDGSGMNDPFDNSNHDYWSEEPGCSSAIAASAADPTPAATELITHNARTTPIAMTQGCIGPHKCTVCGVAFREQYQLARHVLIHSADRPYSCQTCGMSFALKVELKEHRTEAHIKEETNESNIREMDLILQTAMPKAKRSKCIGKKTTTQEKHECIVCGAHFSKLQHLARHETAHSGLRPHACQMCEKSFKRRDNLKEHVIGVHFGVWKKRDRNQSSES
ncbi:hypothetical protein PFISCL1PPCAC_29158, partial [Pristionchus fissidentatus]